MKFFKGIIGCAVCLILFSAMGCRDMGDQLTDLDTPDSVSADDVSPAGPNSGALVFTNAPSDRYGTDAYVINSAAITGDTLEVSVSYSGGCEEHRFTLIVSESFLESHPVQLHISLAHDANGDACEAWPTETYIFNLSPIKGRYQEAYRQEAGTIILQLADAPDGALHYEFGME